MFSVTFALALVAEALGRGLSGTLAFEACIKFMGFQNLTIVRNRWSTVCMGVKRVLHLLHFTLALDKVPV